MDIENIKNKTLKELVISVEKNDASSTIDADLEDALNESSNDEELIQNWQGKLESLYNETQHYWGGLENMKSKVKPKNVKPVEELDLTGWGVSSLRKGL